MKFLNWLGIDEQDLQRIPYEIGRDWTETLVFIGGIVMAFLIAGSVQ